MKIDVDKKEARFEVVGAGELVVGKVCSTGNAVGPRIAVSWGRNGEAPGVLDVEEAKELVDFLNNWINFHDQHVKRIRKHIHKPEFNWNIPNYWEK